MYKKLENGEKGAFLVTFKPVDLTVAHSPNNLIKVLQFEKHFLAGMSTEEFVSSGQYHDMRGKFVFQRVTDHHKLTRKKIKEIAPGVTIASTIPISNSFLLIGTKEDVKALEKSELVTEIHTNDSFHVALPVQTEKALKTKKGTGLLGRFAALGETQAVQWNIAKIGATGVWELSRDRGRGQGVVYAIADTGVAFKHPNIRQNYLGLKADGTYNHNKCWYDGVRRAVAVDGRVTCGFASPEPCDDQGHGTHVTSTAVGADGYGVAPGTKWMACRNMDRGVGSPETYLNCLNFFLAPHDLDGRNPDPSRRPHVVGNSYGCPDSEGCSKRAMNAAVDALRAAGVFMSVSAGNEGPGCSTIRDPPAIERNVISVGATDINDQLAPFSSRGPVVIGGEVYRKPDISAPGVRVLAAYPGDGYRALSGTSMASPHVGGAVALITAMCPCIARDVDKIQTLLEQTAVRLRPRQSANDRLCGGDRPDSVPNNYFGYGRIDVLKAVRACMKYCQVRREGWGR